MPPRADQCFRAVAAQAAEAEAAEAEAAQARLSAIASRYRADPINGVGKRRNVAAAEWNVNGKQGSGIAVSGDHPNPNTVGMPMKPQFSHSRDADSEWQLLEHIANGLPRGATGRIDLYTEREPCGDCQNVISQFEQAYPGVKVNVSWG